ncbi:hypothetical protein KFK09_028226 [Dendrobium nobile]|uniref:Reverse transcriptase zinc-binding domain-containing protein n=1 Tax=Dendrobium nobile TaxID=94219 RepID=A0A8T3A121_DENNO|nr:hypothetical protein KFK09_028226 [Dendrobium nobile]
MVSWDTVFKPKQKGGLGIPSLSALNFAFNCSVIYRMYNCPSPLSSWLTAHYVSPWLPHSPKASKFWISVCKTAAIVKSNFKLVITPNAPISLHWDHWCNNSTLVDFVGGVPLDCFSYPLLKNYLSNLNWVFTDDTPMNLKTAVSSFHIHDTSSYCLFWKDCAKAKFRNFLEDLFSHLPDCSWNKLVWRKNNILKHSFYVWLCSSGGVENPGCFKAKNNSCPGDLLSLLLGT